MNTRKVKNKFINLGIWILVLGFVSLFASTPAHAIVTPAKSVLNPVTETLYVPENDATPRIRIYFKVNAADYWQEALSNSIPLEAKCYGIAVWQDQNEGKLLLSINNGTSSKLRYYALDSSGLPVGSPKDVDISVIGSSPMGVALQYDGAEFRAFLAGAGNGRIYYYQYNSASDSWEELGIVYTDYNVYDIALTPAETAGGAVSYKVFASTKVSTGKVIIFNYNRDSNSESLTFAGEVTGLRSPSYLEVNNDKLYLSVNGASGGDIKAYDITDSSPYLNNVKTIRSITGFYGWTAFAISPTGSQLYFTQVQNSAEDLTQIYKIALPLDGNKDLSDLTEVASLESNIDGLVVALDNSVLGATYSGDGSLREVGTAGKNHKPDFPTDMKQFKLDGVTELLNADQFPAEGTTDERQINVKLTVSDPDGDPLTVKITCRKKEGLMTWITYTGLELTDVPSDTEISETIPADGEFVNGEYEWEVLLTDPYGEERRFGYANSYSVVDFIVDAPVDDQGPIATITSPSEGDTVSGIIDIQATIDDTTTGNSNITAAEYFIDNIGNPGTLMDPVDRNFDDFPTENVIKPFDTRLYSKANHVIYVRGQDANGNWGPHDGINIYVDNPAPTVTSIDPNNGVQGEAVVIINLIGTNFVDGATVKLALWPAEIDADTYEYFSSTHIRCRIAIPLDAEVGTWNVVVTNPDDQSGQMDNAFTVYPQGSGAPKITSITPDGGNAGETVSITDLAGENFIDGATVKLARTGQTDIDGTNITIVNANQITCDFNIPSNAAIGPWTVMVTNPDTQTAQLVDGFIVYGGEGPTVTSIDPNNGVQGETIAIINLIGTNFVDGATVELTRIGQSNITANSPTVFDAEHITCEIAIPLVAEVGAWHVVVTNIDTQSGQLDNAFTVYAPGTAPTITSIAPDNGDRDTTVSVTIDGTNFDSRITDGDVKLARTGQSDMYATSVNFVNANQITCNFDIPAGAVTGSWTLMVTNPDRQTGSLVDGFRVTGGGNPEIRLTYVDNRGNIFWISVPYNTPSYTTVSDIIADINAQNSLPADSGDLITSVGRWVGTANPQVYESYDYLGFLGWSGTDFSIEPGEALYLNIAADATFTLQGNHDPTFVFDLLYDSSRGNVFWSSLPYSGDFTDAVSIIADLNTSAGLPADSGDLVTSIGRWNGDTQAYESYDYLGFLGWSGENFSYEPVEGYYLNIAGNVDSWSPGTR